MPAVLITLELINTQMYSTEKLARKNLFSFFLFLEFSLTSTLLILEEDMQEVIMGQSVIE